MSRKVARESIYKLIFEYLFSQESNQRTFDIMISGDFSEIDREYMQTAYTGIIAHYDELISIIEGYSEGFVIDRIFRTDLAALLVATYEMMYMKDIPLSVSISEAVELVKRYSTDKSNQFVNGILSSIYKKISEKDSGNGNN